MMKSYRGHYRVHENVRGCDPSLKITGNVHAQAIRSQECVGTKKRM